MVEAYTLTHNYYDPDVGVKLPLTAGVSTRGNKYKQDFISL